MIDWNLIFSQIATVAFDIVYFGAIIGTIIVVILDNRNPVKTMAWILVLMFLPIVGLVFYFFFGRSQRRERIIGKKSYGRLLKKPMAEYLAQDPSIVLLNCFNIPIRLFLLKEIGWKCLLADILNSKPCCASYRRLSGTFIWSIISLKMIQSGAW